jgi:gamma-glutamylcyclotransferase (GGCT)/AIG2-like uncharacterized protein YtfP
MNDRPRNITTVFVYGTLRTGHGNWRGILAPYVGINATTKPEYTMRSWGGFPAVYDNGEHSITGELFYVEDDTLEQLDRLEGHPNWYKREEIEVTDNEGQVVVAWMYVMPKSKTQGEIVENGNWNDHVQVLTRR